MKLQFFVGMNRYCSENPKCDHVSQDGLRKYCLCEKRNDEEYLRTLMKPLEQRMSLKFAMLAVLITFFFKRLWL